MAATMPFTPAEAELISSLNEDEIPAKLRCAICSKLAVNAYKTPCCEQLIDESCHSTLPTTCPVCEHTPLSAADCNPNKAMRSTVKVFLKTELKKRETSRAKEAKESAPPTPLDSKPNTQASSTIAQDPAVDSDQAKDAASTLINGFNEPEPHSAAQEEPADQKESPEALSKDPTQQEQPAEKKASPEPDQLAVGDVQEGMAAPQNDTSVAETSGDGDVGQQNEKGVTDVSGYDMTGGGAAFTGMNFGGDFNQMQMMMAMQNGMMPNNFSFPMMGMPGAGMDPMMQNMYMNGGFGSQGMGMNGMNMMGGGYGNNGSNWSGQQSWEMGQDNYNHPSAMGNGDYGPYNSGFHTGFNQQGNFGHQNHYGPNRGYGRGRGRGRGFYGGQSRGGYHNYGSQGNYQDRNHMSQHYGSNQGEQPSHQLEGSSAVADNTDSSVKVDEFGRAVHLRTDSGEAREDGQEIAAQGSTDAATGEANEDRSAAAPSGEKTSSERLPGEGVDKVAGDEPVSSRSVEGANAADTEVRPVSSNGVAGQSRRENSVSMPPPALPSPDVPLNAPIGPKAMRQGLPNTSYLHLRARGLTVADERGQRPAMNDNDLRSPSLEHGSQSRSHSPGASKRRDSTRHQERSRDRDRTRGQSRDREGKRHGKDHSRSNSRSSRSRSRDRKEHRRRHRHSDSMSDSGRDEDAHRRSRHRSSRKYSTYDDEEEPKSSRSKGEKHDERSRSVSPDDSRRSSHRSRRDRDSDKRRDRDKERDRDGERDHRRRGSHRDRDYDRDYDREHERKDRDKDKDRTRDRHHDRDRDHDRDHRHRSSRKGTDEPRTPVDAPKPPLKPPTGPRGAGSIFEIKGASSRPRDGPKSFSRPSQSQSSKAAPPAEQPATEDPYQAEREKRQRERLLAEAQKLAGLQSLAGSKRGRDEVDDSRRNRRKGRGGVVSMDDMGERLRRGEAERESSRA